MDMKQKNIISIISKKANHKPNMLLNKHNAKCPFCDKEHFYNENLLLQDGGEFLWVKNKYPVFGNTNQTLVIETDECGKDFSNYDDDYAVGLVKFMLQCRRELIKSGKYAEVLLFKNHGIEACSSVAHAHTQICGMIEQTYDYVKFESSVEGPVVYEDKHFYVTVSEIPHSEFYEFNIVWQKDADNYEFVKWIQTIVRYFPHFKSGYPSYNFALHETSKEYMLKIIPRKIATSILMLGFGLKQTPDDTKDVAIDLRKFAFQK